jgi:DNA-binding winged helix-turn-helix (wHTH) protein/Tfp pilus assembly protein PilF
MTDSGGISPKLRFGDFEIDRDACELRCDGQRVPLQIQPFRVLEALVDRAGEVVTRAELRASIWPATIFVDFDHGLNSAMTRLRRALRDSSEAPRFIETLPRIGYRFVHAIERADVKSRPVATIGPYLLANRQVRTTGAMLLLVGLFGAAVLLYEPAIDDASLATASASVATASADARIAYLRGLDFFEQRNKEAIARSIEYLQQATVADPDFAAAHAALARAYVSAGGNNSMAKYLDADDVLGPALAAAERALQLDPKLAQAHLAVASVLNGLQAWSPATDFAIEQAYRRALEFDPAAADTRLSFGNFLSTRGRSDAAASQFHQAAELDPLSPSISSRLGLELVALGQIDAGIERLRDTVELDPWQFNAQWRLGWAYVAADDLDAAQHAFESAERISPGSVRSQSSLAFIASRQGDEASARAILSALLPVAEALDDPFDLAIVYVGLKDQDKAIEWLAKAARQTRTLHMQAPWGIHAPMYDWLRGDARFAAIVDEIRLANARDASSESVL